MSVIKKAEALGKEIIDSSEYNSMKTAEENVNEDDQASSLMDEFRSKQQNVQMAQENGQQISPQDQSELQAMYGKLQTNDKIKDLMIAQKNFNDLMQTVNQTIDGILQADSTPQ